MERKNLIAQIYGYAICLVAVITLLASLTSLLNAVIDMNNPLYAWGRIEKDLSSFQNYKVDAMKSIQKESVYIPDDNAIREMYEAAKTEKINRVKHNSIKSIMVSGILILLSLALFIIHWFWLKRLRKV